MRRRAVLSGFVIWAGGTLGVRLAGHRLLHPGEPALTIFLYAVSFALMGWFVPRICRRLGIVRESWPEAALLLIVPTLVLDPFSCVFITTVFPNLEPGAAGAFGGWMLVCCGGGVAGVLARR